MKRVSQAGASVTTVAAALGYLVDDFRTPWPRQPRVPQQTVTNFLLLCEKNQVVTTQQQLEKFATYGGSSVPDPYQ